MSRLIYVVHEIFEVPKIKRFTKGLLKMYMLFIKIQILNLNGTYKISSLCFGECSSWKVDTISPQRP